MGRANCLFYCCTRCRLQAALLGQSPVWCLPVTSLKQTLNTRGSRTFSLVQCWFLNPSSFPLWSLPTLVPFPSYSSLSLFLSSPSLLSTFSLVPSLCFSTLPFSFLNSLHPLLSLLSLHNESCLTCAHNVLFVYQTSSMGLMFLKSDWVAWIMWYAALQWREKFTYVLTSKWVYTPDVTSLGYEMTMTLTFILCSLTTVVS